MGTPRKHAELIKAWADGAEIQCRSPAWKDWKDIPKPNWYTDEQFEYRIKPDVEIPEGFTPWNGGHLPVDPKCFVEIKMRSGNTNRGFAVVFRWNEEGLAGDIIAYKVLKNAPVVRWQWIVRLDDERPYLTSYFYQSIDDLRKMYPNHIINGKAEWTRTEFDE